LTLISVVSQVFIEYGSRVHENEVIPLKTVDIFQTVAEFDAVLQDH